MSKIHILIQKHLENNNKTALKYPNRMKEIHRVPCKNCPSVYYKKIGTIDPETEDILNSSREIQMQSIFPCGWRPSKLCKGYCDQLNIKQKDL